MYAQMQQELEKLYTASAATITPANDPRDIREVIAKCPEHLFSIDDKELAPINDA